MMLIEQKRTRNVLTRAFAAPGRHSPSHPSTSLPELGVRGRGRSGRRGDEPRPPHPSNLLAICALLASRKRSG